MPDKPERLRSTGDFRQVYGRGMSVAGDYLVAYVWLSGRPGCRLGLSVSRRVGKAVVRNRIRRRLREAFRTAAGELLPDGSDIVLVARKAAAEADYHNMEKEIERIVKKISGKLPHQAKP